MRFELFQGARSLGTVTWERPGRVRVRLRDDGFLGPILARFEARASDPDVDGGVVLTTPEPPTSDEFETAMHDLARTLGLTLAPRPAPGSEDRPTRRA